MSETVAIALITALAGFFGALLGAASAVVGPWWLSRSERKAQVAAETLEMRRLAIVEWFDAKVDMAASAEDPKPSQEQAHARTVRGNRAGTELASRISAEDEAVVAWMSGVSYVVTTLPAKEQIAFIGVAQDLLFRWHRGTLSTSRLKPFELVYARDGKAGIHYTANW
jgi:hypothetical protein